MTANKTERRATWLGCLAGVAALAGGGPAEAASYTYTPVADNSGPFSQAMNVAINNGGTVLVEWLMDNGNNSIDLYTPTGPRNVAFGGSQAQSPYFTVAFPGLNNPGQVGFLGGPYSPLSVRIVRDTGGVKQTIRQLPDPNNDSFGNGTSINDSGTLAYRQSIGGVRTIQRTDGVTSTTIAQEGANNVQFLYDPTINNLGQVSYRANLTTSVVGIYRSNGTTTTTIADTSGPIGGLANVPTALNNAGQVAFAAELDAGGQVLYVSDGVSATPIVDTSGPISELAWVAINDVGQVAYLASLDAGGGGIYAGPNTLTDKVIATGDPLFGSTVQSLLLYTEGLNDAGQVAFRYQLANGTRGVAVATVPEPTAVIPLALSGAAMLIGRRRRGTP